MGATLTPALSLSEGEGVLASLSPVAGRGQGEGAITTRATAARMIRGRPRVASGATAEGRGQRQSRVTTATGSDTPRRVTTRGAESVLPAGTAATVSWLTRISPGSASAPTRAATCTPFPR